MHNSYVQ